MSQKIESVPSSSMAVSISEHGLEMSVLVWKRFKAYYPRWAVQAGWQTQEDWDNAIELWAEELAEYTPDIIITALKKTISHYTNYPPNIGDFTQILREVRRSAMEKEELHKKWLTEKEHGDKGVHKCHTCKKLIPIDWKRCEECGLNGAAWIEIIDRMTKENKDKAEKLKRMDLNYEEPPPKEKRFSAEMKQKILQEADRLIKEKGFETYATCTSSSG